MAFLAGLCGCGQATRSEPEYLAVAAPSEDVALEAATNRARQSLPEFTARLRDHSPQQTDFSIKVEVHDEDVIHYFWLQRVRYVEPHFTGVLGQDAVHWQNHRPGEVITVPADQVFDWMYVEDGKLHGGFSTRAIRSHLSGKQREAFDKTLWYSIDLMSKDIGLCKI
jgi:uncharacterized protein YegJ (DUF2314 family)